MTNGDIVIVGSGDHARVVHELVEASGRTVAGYVITNPAASTSVGPILGTLESHAQWATESIEFTIAIGDNKERAVAFERCVHLGIRPARLLHPTAIALAGASVEAGAQVCAGAIIGVGARISANAIVNTGATVDHDSTVGMHATVAPGAHLAGRVTVEEGAYIGIGGIVRQGLTIGRWALVAAGAVVIDDVSPQTRVRGVPARRMTTGSGGRISR